MASSAQPVRPGVKWRAVLCMVAIACFFATAAGAVDFPALTGRVVDDANLLSAAARQSLTEVLAAHEAKTTNQVVVVTVPSLQGLTIEQFGYQLGRHWGIGQKGKDNGVLLIVAPNERKVRIEVGYGLEGTLTDALASGIIQNAILPEFRTGRFENGILQGTDAILTVLGDPTRNGMDAAKPPEADSGGLDVGGATIGGIILLIIFFGRVYGGIYGRRRFGGGWGSSGGGFGGGGFGGGGGGFGGGGSSGGW